MSEKKASNIVNPDSPTANMYGCEPCPRCDSEYRATYRTDGGRKVIVCDDCGFNEEAAEL